MYIAYKYILKYKSHIIEVHAQFFFTNGVNDKSLETAAVLMW